MTAIAGIREASVEMETAKARLEEVDRRLREAGPLAKRHKQLTTQLEMRVRGKKLSPSGGM